MTVARSGRVAPVRVSEGERGSIISIADGIPFTIRRTYVIKDVADPGALRGDHAHLKNDQALFVLSGGITLHLDDGTTTEDIALKDGDDGVLVGRMVWHSMSHFMPGTVILVLASEPYDPADYIRNHDEFKKHAGSI
jgi:mannose-6-phosphate isomerase-like protein (cupin superfamily)